MSLIHPHIRTLRAEADALDEEAESARVETPDAAALSAMARAKRRAADRLEKEERDRLERATARQ